VIDIGGSLAAARETRGLSLADAERLTCIRGKHLSALERGAFDALPGRTYARAFLRTYANALGLDADQFVAAFEELVPEPADESVVAVPSVPRRRHLYLRPLAAVFAVGIVVGVVAWTSRSPTTHRLGPSTPSAGAARGRHATGSVLGTRHTTAPAHKVARSAQPAALVIRATRGRCWVLVRQGGASGTVLYEQTLAQGAVVRFTAPRLWLRLGAPGMVDVSRGSKRVPGLSGLTPVNVVA
jgi:cytoskeleton protein RodZ